MKRVGLLCHPKIDGAQRLVEELVQVLSTNNIVSWVESAWDVDAMQRSMAESEMVITLGGDGTIIRAARVAAPYEVPVLGINFGELGFLAEVEPKEALHLIPKVLRGDHWIEKRMLLNVAIVRNDEVTESMEAVNEIFAGRGETPRAVRVTTRVDGAEMQTYTADGVLVATPTGSTAYALAAGGPILAPELLAILVTPIVPHPTPYPCLVVGANSEVEVSVQTHHDAVLAIDGQINRPLRRGDRVTCSRGEHAVSFVRLNPPSSFYSTLMEKLFLGDDTDH